MQVQDLDVFLRGSRNYVQGTQIVSRTADLTGKSGWVFKTAAFSTITTNYLSAVEGAAPQGQDVVAKLMFASPESGTKSFSIFERNDVAPQRDEAMPISLDDRQEVDDTTSIWPYDGAKSFEDILNVLVQATKAEHVHRWPDAFDIWFTGARGWQIPLDLDSLSGGTVTLKMYRQMGVPSAVQTIWQIEINDTSGAAFQGMFTFVHKSGED